LAWATGTALTTARTNFNGESIGTQTAGLAAAGEPPSPPPGGSTQQKNIMAQLGQLEEM
jgi:hypothetical protein